MEHPEWALKHKKSGCELRLIRGKYYLYEYKTVYDSQKKGPKKITGKFLGSITEKDGFIPSGKRELERSARKVVGGTPVCREYGVSYFIAHHLTKYTKVLKRAFPEHWEHVLAMAYCRLVYRCPLKNIPYRMEQSFLPELIPMDSFHDKTASSLLHVIGGMRPQQLAYMRSFIGKGEYLLMDATPVHSNSNKMSVSRLGYSSSHGFDSQFNLLYLYSSRSHIPVYYRILPGNIREVKAFKNSLAEAGLTKAVIVADKGFYSAGNVEQLRQEKLRFILPLKRDNAVIDYSMIQNNTFKEADQYFEHEGRIIWYQEYIWDRMNLNIYLDDSLRTHEEQDYLRRITTHPEVYSLEAYHQRKNTFGTITMLTNLSRSKAKDIYQTYKSRGAIETMFDGMKNVLEADSTYMQNEQTLQGWMFINHIALQWYQHLYCELKEKDMISKYSVNDYIQILTDAKMIKINNAWYQSEITKATQKLIQKIGINLT